MKAAEWNIANGDIVIVELTPPTFSACLDPLVRRASMATLQAAGSLTRRRPVASSLRLPFAAGQHHRSLGFHQRTVSMLLNYKRVSRLEFRPS